MSNVIANKRIIWMVLRKNDLSPSFLTLWTSALSAVILLRSIRTLVEDSHPSLWGLIGFFYLLAD